jgi:hypothetical protein
MTFGVSASEATQELSAGLPSSATSRTENDPGRTMSSAAGDFSALVAEKRTDGSTLVGRRVT